jgi:dipeptidyl-peptidase-4
MLTHTRLAGRIARVSAVLAIALAIAPLGAQDRLKSMPGYDTFTKMQGLLQQGPAFVSGALTVTWESGGRSFTYATGGKAYRYDLATMSATVTGDAPAAAGPGRGGRGGVPPAGPPPAGGRAGRGAGQAALALPPGQGCPQAQVARGRQADCVVSPNQRFKAYYRDRNIWLSNVDGTAEIAITKDGDEKARTKYGTGSWVYGEELGQTTAIWWSPDSKKVGFYRFDEGQVKDFFLQMDQTKVQDSLDVEAYPKPGQPNPVADVLVYDIASDKVSTLDVRDGLRFTNDVVGHYAYDVRWSPDGTEVLLNRTNRRQQIMELVACSPATTKCRVVVHEEWLTGWTDNRPRLQFLADNKRFIWPSHRNGWPNYYLHDLTGKLISPITNNTTFESGAVVKVDETAGVLFYMARDGDNYMKTQLHCVGLDGKGDVRLTDPKFNHTVSLSADNKFIVDVYQTHDIAPATQLLDGGGKVLGQLAKSDLTRFTQLGLKPVEMFTYKAADGQTTLYGTIAFPSSFDQAKKYPTLMGVYGGPASGSNVPTENFAAPNPVTEYGFLSVNLSSRAAPGMGRRTLDSIYLKLGQTEMDDMAEGIKALWARPYFDKGRVGINGSSYGGYTSAMEILRHPDVFQAASAASPPTDWRNYDTIYTERYMWIPEENKDGYDKGSAMAYAKDLRGRLLIYYGTADNNVHPNNAMQLIKALQQAGKSFEVQVGPDTGHSNVGNPRMMEFFIENLVMHPERLMAPGGAGTGLASAS